MKILFAIDTMSGGGKERRLTELMKALKRLPDFNFELAVMTLDIYYKEVYDLGINIYYFIRGSRKDVTVFGSFYRLCKKSRPDIVHCWDTMTAVYLSPVCKLLHIKLVNGMVTDTLVRKNIFNKYGLRARLTFPFSDIIVGNSVTGLASYKAPKKKSVCIYNGMDLNRFKQLKEPSIMLKEIVGDIPDDFFIVGMVAAFAIRKDYRTLLKAAIDLSIPYKNIRFIFVGDGNDFESVKKSIPVTMENKIILLGKRSDVESIINIFDIGVLLTNSKAHGEGVSNSIIEYMALGKPVIATRGGGTDEVVIDNLNGFLIAPEDTGQLKEKICLLMKDRKLATRLGNEGRKMVKEKFDLEIMTKNYIELYNKLISL